MEVWRFAIYHSEDHHRRAQWQTGAAGEPTERDIEKEREPERKRGGLYSCGINLNSKYIKKAREEYHVTPQK